MRIKLKEIWKLTVSAKRQSITIQHRLILYWSTMILSAFAALLLVFSFAGVFSDTAHKLADTLDIQQKSTVSALSKQMNELTAQGISLSNGVSKMLGDTLAERGLDIDDLNDNPDLIAEVETVLYSQILSTLSASDCNGVFVLLNATANTKADGAEWSRMGVYLRYSDLNSTSSANQRLIYFRGVPDVSRQKQVRMHNRWNLEFDTTQIPCYDMLMNAKVSRLADCCIWSERINLKDTWEKVLLLFLPILDSSGNVCGICGIEVSELYFYLSYPTIDSNYGSMVTMLAPMDGDDLLLEKAMIGNASGTRLAPSGTMSVKKKDGYNIYAADTEQYFGQHQSLDVTSLSGLPLAAVTLIPQSGYEAQISSTRIRWIIGSLLFLLCMLILTLLLSRRFVQPIKEGLKAIQTEAIGIKQSGISEIDELFAFVQSLAGEKDLKENRLPPNIEELLQNFKRSVDLLTPTERRMLQYYIDGYSLKEIPTLAFISISTAKTHNTNINKKLRVTTHEELMLYIDLFRRCGRLQEIKYELQ